MSYNILFGDKSREKILRGIRIMQEAVGCTMGPDGKTMLIERGRYGDPILSKDGVTVAKYIKMEDPEEAMGAGIVYEAASNTNRLAGDATTCAVVLAAAMIEAGQKHVASGRNVNHLRKGMLRAAGEIVERLKKDSKPIDTEEEIRNIAAISSQDKEMAKIITDVLLAVGEDSTITVDINQDSPGIKWEVLNGMQFPKGWKTPLFITDQEKAEYNRERVAVIVSEDEILRQDQILPIMDKALKIGYRDIVIIAPHMSEECLKILIINRAQGRVNPCFVQAPEYGERRRQILMDIALFTGGTFFSSDLGSRLPEGIPAKSGEIPIKGIEDAVIGTAQRVIVTQERTTIVDGDGDKEKIKEHIEEIRAMANRSEGYEKEFHRERIGRLTSGVGKISVSASTEFESEELRLRLDDALSAVRAAMEEGILPGGGTALLRAAKEAMIEADSDDEIMGWMIVREACSKPAWQITTNSGMRGDAVVEGIIQGVKGFGYDASTRSMNQIDLMKAGIIDPLKAIRCALENAVSVAANFLTMHGTITEVRVPEVPRGK